MEKIVLDTHAAIAFICNEPGAEKAHKALAEVLDNGGTVYMSAVNYGEFFYSMIRKAGQQGAIKARHSIDMIPLSIIDADKEHCLLAAGYKSTKKMSYADCFAAALARILEAPVLTGDREFKQVEKEIKIIWI